MCGPQTVHIDPLHACSILGSATAMNTHPLVIPAVVYGTRVSAAASHGRIRQPRRSRQFDAVLKLRGQSALVHTRVRQLYAAPLRMCCNAGRGAHQRKLTGRLDPPQPAGAKTARRVWVTWRHPCRTHCDLQTCRCYHNKLQSPGCNMQDTASKLCAWHSLACPPAERQRMQAVC
jgi:hypothetical protein